MEIAIIFDVVVREIGCKQAVNRTANEFILNAFVVLPVMVINRLIPGNLAYPQSKTIDKPHIFLNHTNVILSLPIFPFRIIISEKNFFAFFLYAIDQTV